MSLYRRRGYQPVRELPLQEYVDIRGVTRDDLTFIEMEKI
jgi:hypothetical protein